LCDRSHGHQPGVAQGLHVLRRLGLAKRQPRSDFTYGCRTVAQQLDDPKTVRFGQSGKH
jgi:hypothetical protein